MQAVGAICPSCQGEGHHSLAMGSFTQDEWAMESEEFKEGYLNGEYDQPCETCDGTGKVLVPDYHRADPELLKAYEQYLREDEHDAAMYRAEMRQMRDY